MCMHGGSRVRAPECDQDPTLLCARMHVATTPWGLCTGLVSEHWYARADAQPWDLNIGMHEQMRARRTRRTRGRPSWRATVRARWMTHRRARRAWAAPRATGTRSCARTGSACRPRRRRRPRAAPTTPAAARPRTAAAAAAARVPAPAPRAALPSPSRCAAHRAPMLGRRVLRRGPSAAEAACSHCPSMPPALTAQEHSARAEASTYTARYPHRHACAAQAPRAACTAPAMRPRRSATRGAARARARSRPPPPPPPPPRQRPTAAAAAAVGASCRRAARAAARARGAAARAGAGSAGGA